MGCHFILQGICLTQESNPGLLHCRQIFFFLNRLSYQGIPSIILMAGEGNGNPIQYSCLENPMDRGSWQATVYAVAESQT